VTAIAGSCEHGQELSRSINAGTFFDVMSDYQLLKQGPAPWSYFVRCSPQK
jgi:hypothetical protein